MNKFTSRTRVGKNADQRGTKTIGDHGSSGSGKDKNENIENLGEECEGGDKEDVV